MALPGGDRLYTIYTSTASRWTLLDPTVVPTCPPAPVSGCQPAATLRSVLSVKRDELTSKNKLTWKWKSSAAVTSGDFGAPLTASNYLLCVYGAGAPPMGAVAPAGQLCAGKPCWRQTATKGFAHSDKERTPVGLKKIVLKAGEAGKAKITLKGEGPALGPVSLPLTTPAVVQLTRLDGGPCWEATYGTSTKKDETQFKATSD